MSDFTLVDPRGWEYDLHSVYSAYIGYFQVNNITCQWNPLFCLDGLAVRFWYDRSWGHLFSTFEDFLAFSWPCITCTDVWTGRAHIVTRLTSIGAFLKMIKTRFGETLPQAPNILQVQPFETTSRPLRTVSDYASYKRLHSTLSAAVLSALKLRVRAGEPKAVKELWASRDRTFLAIDFEWSERNEKSCLEWGYAAIRCGHLEALGHWPPVPDANYRKGHYIVQEYVDKVINKHCPTHPWQYAFGDSQVCPKAKLPQIIQAIISSLASPDSETIPNTLVLVAHGISGDLSRMEEMKIKLPHNMLILDTATFERALFAGGHRSPMIDPHTSTPGNPKPRGHGSTLSLENLLRSLPSPSDPQSHNPALQTQVLVPGQFPQPGAMVPGVVMHNSGNDAFMCLYALQLLLEPEGTQAPAIQKKTARPVSFAPGMNSSMNGMGMNGGGLSPSGLVGDFAQLYMHVRPGSTSPGLGKGSMLSVPQSPSKHAHGNGHGTGNGPGTPGRSSRRLSAMPSGDGWSNVRRG
ncbi:ATP-synt-DE-N domain-containing protein [Mycena venus]|uniref:ATP-synt-DE-N domain-containing protein n=1 Tax=Mycena venus TaxID=2733690 RepID=A0A8H6U0X0_9AGAR|nr:ATP-synt-DE-N domain-containing protein [Mycena venus]